MLLPSNIAENIFSSFQVDVWHSNDNPISTNVDIPGYTLFKTSSLTQNGGVGLYIRNSLTSKPRIDLDSCTTDFEPVWVEIENKRDKDFLICCVYRHASSNVDNLTSHFQNLLSKIPSNKLLFIMGYMDYLTIHQCQSFRFCFPYTNN